MQPDFRAPAVTAADARFRIRNSSASCDAKSERHQEKSPKAEFLDCLLMWGILIVKLVCTDMKEKVKARLRELAPRGQREPGAGLTQPSLHLFLDILPQLCTSN